MIFKSRKYFEKVNYTYQEYLAVQFFSIKKFYRALQVPRPEVIRRRLICNNLGAPKQTFLHRVTTLGRLYTRDRLVKWGITRILVCLLCLAGLESMGRLFFMCPFSNCFEVDIKLTRD